MSFIDKLKKGLSRTKTSFFSPINSLLRAMHRVDEDLLRKIGINVTFEPRYQAKKLFHK